MYYWFLAGNVFGWNKFYVNYKKLFKFNNHYSTLPQILIRVSLFSSLYLIVFLTSMAKINYDWELSEVLTNNLKFL